MANGRPSKPNSNGRRPSETSVIWVQCNVPDQYCDVSYEGRLKRIQVLSCQIYVLRVVNIDVLHQIVRICMGKLRSKNMPNNVLERKGTKSEQQNINLY